LGGQSLNALNEASAASVKSSSGETRAPYTIESVTAALPLVPLLSAGALPVVGVLAVAAFATASPGSIAALLLTIALAHISIAVSARKLDFAEARRSKRSMTLVTLAAGAFGLLWGITIAEMLASGHITMQIAALVAAGAVACWSAPMLAAMPRIGGLFLLPLAAGTALTLLDDGAAPFHGAVICVLVLMGTTAVYSRTLVAFFRRYLANRTALRDQHEIVRILLKEFGTSPSDWIWHFDDGGRIDRVTERFAAVAPPNHGNLVGSDFCAFLRKLSDENEPTVLEIEHDIRERAMFQDVIVKIDRDDEEYWWRLTGKPRFDSYGVYSGYVGTASDVTTGRLAERKINFLAHYDSLTGLLNRGKFTEHLNHAVSRLERYGTPFTILYLDLDQFKAVNDTRGHLIGDKLLAEVSQRIRSTIAETDLAARLGGDEFAIILTNKCESEAAGNLAGRLVDTICKPYHLEDETVSIGVSIGIAMAPLNGTRPDQILRNADLALYRAKADGRATYRFFETHMDASIRERRILELELRQAIKNGEFVLHYQPLVSAESQKPNAFEALVRWNHPIRGIVPPAEFIPIAEQSGLIQQIGDWTIREACQAAAHWPNEMGVAVNLSARHFHLSDISGVVRQALAESGLAPDRLELEITESLLILNPDDVIRKLKEIKELGISIAMDDFGTGYSSLSYLLKFPFDKIKIDKSFVTASSEDIAARDILRTIVSLAKSLKIRITAEGVETQGQVDFLRDLACNQLQGYYFAKALDEIDMSAYLMSGIAEGLKQGEQGTAPEPLWRKSA
jgi:diguanylate cyclase (GGDEF)-like protein